jgi:hypothetical protein
MVAQTSGFEVCGFSLRAAIIPRDVISCRLKRHADFDEGWLTAHIAENAMSALPAEVILWPLRKAKEN